MRALTTSSLPPSPAELVRKKRSSLRFASDLRTHEKENSKDSPSVLLIGSSPSMLAAQEVLLGTFPVVLLSTSLADASEVLEETMVDVCLIDMEVEGEGVFPGLDLVRKIAPEAATILLSSVKNEDMALAAIAKGAQDYLNKGNLDYDALPSKVKHARERKNKEELLGKLASSMPYKLCLTGVISVHDSSHR